MNLRGPVLACLIAAALGFVPANGHAAEAVLTPPPPTPSSPVTYFRKLLAMTPPERREALTNRPPEIRKQILAKVREYESLKPNEREVRLQVTELRYYLSPLMRAAETNRAVQLGTVPEPIRGLVQTRLLAWDHLPADGRKELLDNEAALTYFTDVPAEKRDAALTALSPARRQLLERGIRQWDSLPERQREKLLDRFDRFFALSGDEKEHALNTLSEAERQQIERTLRNFDRLPARTRVECIRSFEKFANLSLEERQQFLKNAERWKVMSPAERQSWRELVGVLSTVPPSPAYNRMPPAPPGLPPPPLPTRMPKGPAVAGTNGR